MKVLLVDNFDSFTWNLVDYVSVVEDDTVVETNRLTLDRAREVDPDAIVVSPGPGHPARDRDSGNALEVIEAFEETPTLGVCLGHQMLATAYGGSVDHAPEPVHGKASPVEHDGRGIYDGIPQEFQAGRYHSLCVTDVPDGFEVAARGDGIVMGMRHAERPQIGVQYHPESVLTGAGHDIVENFLSLARGHGSSA